MAIVTMDNDDYEFHITRYLNAWNVWLMHVIVIMALEKFRFIRFLHV